MGRFFNRKALHYLFLLLFFIVLAFGTAFSSSPNIRNYLGEELFLKFQLRTLAIYTLNTGKSNRSTDYKTYFLLGRIYFVDGDLDKSINAFNQSIELNNTHKESFYGRGLSYGFYDNRYLTQAQIDFEKYIELEEKEFEDTSKRAYGGWAGYNDLAWIHFLKGESLLQEMVARKGIRIYGHNPWLDNILGISLIAQKKCDEATKYLESARRLVEETDVEEFGEAYSGDGKKMWPTGLNDMRQTIVENLELCNKKLIY